MKKLVWLLVCCLYFTMHANAQSIAILGSRTFPCAVLSTSVLVTGSVPGLKIKLNYGDGTLDTVTSANPVNHTYTFAGTYTVNVSLLSGSVVTDSASFFTTIENCNYCHFGNYLDLNSNCNYDPGPEHKILFPATVEVDSAGVPIDTITWVSDYSYPAYGPVGTIYGFKMLSPPVGTNLTCPAGGIIYDTILNASGIQPHRYFGFECTGSSSFDAAALLAFSRTSFSMSGTGIRISDNSCIPHTDTLTMIFSPKCQLMPDATLFSVTGNVAKWLLPNMSLTSHAKIFSRFLATVTPLTYGDTVHKKFILTSVTGDTDPLNNTVEVVDTVNGPFDPNAKTVYPEGNILAGTNLRYTITFENVGNDTAHNIHIMDTLSTNLDPRSLSVIDASADVTTTVLKVGSYNIVKFDFPNINLLDSSHYGLCDGMVVYTINANAGLPSGTLINNRAGIYFDYNDVVLTNTVSNMIGFPAEAQVMTASKDVKIYPNPARTELFIDNVNNAFAIVSITDILGQQMYSGELNDIQTKVDVRSLPSGTYFVILKGAAGVKTQQFQKL